MYNALCLPASVHASGCLCSYCHLHPGTDADTLAAVLAYHPTHFHWAGMPLSHQLQGQSLINAPTPYIAGADLFNVTNEHAQRQMIVIETNSCPSGQKSMPSWNDSGDSAETSYHRLLRNTFQNLIQSSAGLPQGGLAVVYDKNPMEASGYAAIIAEMSDEVVHLVEFYDSDPNPPAKWDDGVLFVRNSRGGRRTSMLHLQSAAAGRYLLTCCL